MPQFNQNKDQNKWKVETRTLSSEQDKTWWKHLAAPLRSKQWTDTHCTQNQGKIDETCMSKLFQVLPKVAIWWRARGNSVTLILNQTHLCVSILCTKLNNAASQANSLINSSEIVANEDRPILIAQNSNPHCCFCCLPGHCGLANGTDDQLQTTVNNLK